MGCGKSNLRSDYAAPVIRKEDVEIDEVAALPLNAHGESLDLIQVVELHVRCNNIPFDSHTQVLFYHGEYYTIRKDYLEKGKTEVITDSIDPSFITSFHLTYCFEKQEKVKFNQFRFEVYDVRSSPERYEKTNCLGNAEFNIHEVICSESHSITRSLDSRKSNATITVTSEELSRVNHTVKMTWIVLKSNTFLSYLLRVSRVIDDKPVPIYQSESLKLIKGNCKI